jgi:DNA-binding NtrC family response regulator
LKFQLQLLIFLGIAFPLALVNKVVLSDDRLRDLILNRFFDFHTLPVDIDRLKITLGHAYGVAQLQNKTNESCALQSEDGLIGSSKSIEHLRKLIKKAAMSDSPVLITGESGTGKELVASSIHAQSALRKQPYVAVNCASLPGSLIQSELFGHEKGAFTGANSSRIGRIESAAGGSLFLDEIGDLGLDLQVNLLRFLQEKTISRLGGHEELKVDARVIAATHVNLEDAIKAGAFREDLYYRLNVVRINIPPLRERRDDIEYLAQHFFKKYREKIPTQIIGFSSDALKVMRRHEWPGNVRELINRIRQALVMSDGKLITPEDLGLKQDIAVCNLHDLETARAEAEKKTILAMTAFTRRNMTEAARRLGVTRATLYRLIYKHKLEQAVGFDNHKPLNEAELDESMALPGPTTTLGQGVAPDSVHGSNHSPGEFARTRRVILSSNLAAP